MPEQIMISGYQYSEEEKSVSDNLKFVTIAQLVALTGWSYPSVQKLFNHPDFPTCDFGKEKMAELSAVK